MLRPLESTTGRGPHAGPGGGGNSRRLPSRVRRHRADLRAAAALLASGLTACAGVTRSGGPDTANAACVVVPTPASVSGPAAPEASAPEASASAAAASGAARERPDSPGAAPRPGLARAVAVGLPGPVDPAHAPVPRTAAERLVFRQLYETVVRVTCEGRVEPAIAASWRALDQGRRWVFTLRSDARDWDGRPVTAANVASSWRAARAVRSDGPPAGAAPGVASVTVADARTLHVTLTEPVTIAFFARPALAVRTSPGAAGWPTGTGPYRPDDSAQPSTGRARRLTLASRAGGARVEFRTVSGDARNALDAGLDLLVTMDPAVIDYAAASPGFRTVPLAWDRSYLLVVRAAGAPGTVTAAAGRPRVIRLPEEALAALARDAVRARARPALEAFDRLGACGFVAAGARPGTDGVRGAERPGPGPGGRPVRIVYPAGDAVARALTERLVALALDPGRPDAGWLADAAPALAGAGGRVSAAGLAAPAFADAVRAGSDVAYVFPIARRAGTGSCDAVEAVLGRAPWLDRTAPVPPGTGPAVIPLVETRRTLVVRRGIAGVAVDGSGMLLLSGIRRAAVRP